MKKIHRVLALLMAVVMALSLVTTAFAEPTIDPSKKHLFLSTSTTSPRPAAMVHGMLSPTSAPVCMMMPLLTSWQSMPFRAWSSPTSAWPILS